MATPPNMLGISLSAAVPLRIMELRGKGGPDEADWRRAKDFGPVLAERGDRLLFRGKGKKDEGEAAKMFNETAHAIAVMSFLPWGIRVFGQHFQGLQSEGG